MKISKKLVAIFFAAALPILLSATASAQSTDQNFPTPVTSNEIRGTIRARDIGDSRNTTYFYAFDGEQGDIFLNVQTRNFNGDIDVFSTEGMRPLSKIVLYADTGVSETGRVIYLRKGEKLLLRIDGRTPGDDAATFVVKFAGSFVALKPTRRPDDIGPPKVGVDEGVRLNSIGAAITNPEVKKPPVRVDPQPKKETPAKPPATTAKETSKPPITPPRVVVTSGDPPADPLSAIYLTIVLKDGKRIHKPMTDVLRFSTDKGTYTLVMRDGNIIRYQMLNVTSVTIQ